MRPAAGSPSWGRTSGTARGVTSTAPTPTLALTHVAAAEHLYAAGFDVTEVITRFLPYSFRGRLPASPRLTRAYRRCPMLWRVLGKQFPILGAKPG